MSLGTRCYRAAEAAAASLNTAFQTFLKTRPMSDPNIKTALRNYLQEALQKLRTKHLTTSVGKGVHTDPWDGYTAVEADLAAIDQQTRQMRRDIVRRDIRAVESIADRLLPGLETPQRVELALGLLQAHVQLLGKSKEWLTNGLIEEIDLSEHTEQLGNAIPLLTKSSDQEAKPATDSGPTFSEALPPFIELMTQEQGWRGQTLAQNRATYRMFAECCGDRPVSQYARKDLTQFYDLLRGLPALYSKSKEWSSLPLSEIVKRTKGTGHPRMTMKTVKRHFSALGRLFAYLKRRGEYVGENPAHGFEFPTKGRARNKRQMWEGEKLQKLFASPVWTGCLSETRRSTAGSLIIKDEKYWLPILGLFHGNRLEEFAQLVRSDVRCEGEIWFLDINDDDGKQVKNEQSKRRVPIHPRVRELGFLRYVEATAPDPTDRIFPKLQPGGPDQKLGYTFTKWWSRYRKDIGLYERGLDYHAFRGGVTTKLTAAHVIEDIRNELLGHEGTSVDQRVYQKGLPLAVLAEAIARVEWSEFAVSNSQPLSAAFTSAEAK
nr:site-specific integrase [Hyphomicrobium sulfonivorans]